MHQHVEQAFIEMFFILGNIFIKSVLRYNIDKKDKRNVINVIYVVLSKTRFNE